MIEKKDAVYIKSYPKGILLHMNESMDFDTLLQEAEARFEDSRKFFGSAALALATEGRKLSSKETVALLDMIAVHSNIKVICVVDKDASSIKEFEDALVNPANKLTGDEHGQFYRGNLSDKEVLETDTSVIIIGDVCAGSAVISTKNIIVLGGLYGEAYAGGNGNKGAFVAALEMAPERIKIGDFIYKPIEKKSLFKKRKKAVSQIAYVKDGNIVLEEITKEQLSSF